MNHLLETRGIAHGIPWRLIGWGGAVGLLSIPFTAMQFAVPGVDWSLGDFLVAGGIVAVIGGLFELALRTSRSPTYRAAFALALIGLFAVVWVNLSVGIVGSEDNPRNLLFFIALLVGAGGAVGAGLEAAGMARAMLSTAIALVAALALAELGPRDEPGVRPIVEGIGTMIFVTTFIGSAWLFRRAAVQSSSSS